MVTHKAKRGAGRFSTKVAIVMVMLAALILSILIPVTGRAVAGTRAGSDDRHRLGRLLPTSPAPGNRKLMVPAAGRPLSAAVDLSSQLPPIGDQGQQGSCVGWATSYYYKSWSEKKEHPSWDLTNSWYQYSPSFVYNQINGGQDEGAYFADAFTLLENSGDVDIAEMPYDDYDYYTQPTEEQLEAAKPYRIPSGWGYFWQHTVLGPYSRPNDISSIKAWLNSGKMLVFGIPVYDDFPDYGWNPSKSYYDYDGWSSYQGGHAVCICGYNDNIKPSGADADHKGGFLMVNSWGSNWNNNGFVYLSYDFVKRYVDEAWSMGDLAPDGPSISRLSTGTGRVGQQITIYGNNFGTLRRWAGVTFNGIPAQATFTNTQMTATIPPGATSGPVVVRDWTGAPSNPAQFVIPASSSIFYFAEGTCRPGFDPYVCIQNPGGTAASVTLTYMKGNGTTATDQVSVPPNSRVTVNPKNKLGVGNDAAHDFSAKVDCTNGQQIIAERPMYFNYNGVWSGGHDVVGARP